MRLTVAGPLLAALMLGACSGEPLTFRKFYPGDGPDEFLVLPYKPLQMPENLDELPEPAPGTRNLVDPTPREDAVAGLGGNPALLAATAIPATDAALVDFATRYGVTPDIRAVVAEEDLEFRKRKSRFGWKLLRNDEYLRIYRRMMLDAYAELERFRRAGVRTPAAPPAR